MITRNLNFNERLINGQKVQLLSVSANARVLQVKLLDGSNVVLLPRINFKPKLGRNGLNFTRTQFPVRLAYACTINKSQDQTLTKVGLDLRPPVFSHGQLYVALSRARGRRSLMSLVPSENLWGSIGFTKNVVSSLFVRAASNQDPLPLDHIPRLSLPTILQR